MNVFLKIIGSIRSKESKTVIDVKIDEKDSKDIFEEALHDAQVKILSSKIINMFEALIYTKEQIEETKQAGEKYLYSSLGSNKNMLIKEFPNAVAGQYGFYLSLKPESIANALAKKMISDGEIKTD